MLKTPIFSYTNTLQINFKGLKSKIRSSPVDKIRKNWKIPEKDFEMTEKKTMERINCDKNRRLGWKNNAAR